ncbi:MAG: radical SAM protein [Treponema sp.]|jgi:putative pyruvate formate lyase activating enzyme|nr:radical SAM protein [Treponema sp.]
MLDLYKDCRLCPRECGVDRTAAVSGSADTPPGFCGESSRLRLAFAGLHKGEEPPLAGRGGSGTIFVSGCNLGCTFCQNYQITGSRQRRRAALGRAVSEDEFTGICLELQNSGAENINIVTGSHAVPAIVQGITAARSKGLTIPLLWNSSGYEGQAALDILKDCVDVFLPDLKTLDSDIAARFFNAPDYPQAAAAAILKMIHCRPNRVIIRHLILPGCLDSSRAVLRWFAENARGKALLSLMTQYTPVQKTGGTESPAAAPGRFLNQREYETVLGWLTEFGIEDGFCQELVTGSDWLPDFNRPNPFSSELSVPVWSWNQPPPFVFLASGPPSPGCPVN